MSNGNNKQKVEQRPSAKKQQTVSNYQKEEFSKDLSYDAKHFKKREKLSSKNEAESERTAWN